MKTPLDGVGVASQAINSPVRLIHSSRSQRFAVSKNDKIQRAPCLPKVSHRVQETCLNKRFGKLPVLAWADLVKSRLWETRFCIYM